MIKKYIILLILTGWFYSTAKAVDGVECQINIYQFDKKLQKDILTFADTNNFAINIPRSGFIGPLSVEIDVIEVDSAKVNFNIHVITLGPLANTYTRNFLVEHSLPAKICGIKGKNDALYTLVVTPLSKIDIDTTTCSFQHRTERYFTFKPTAYMDIYYIPNSLGDYYWNSVKELLENNFRRFQSFGNFTLPGKTLVYLCPCPVNTVIWDDRFGMAIDPTKNIAFSIYDKNINTTDPFIVTHTAVLRNYGYAPPFLSEGLANYFSFAIFDMKKIIKVNDRNSLTPFLDTYRYLQADPKTADRVASTFVKFLINQYHLDRFMKLYKSADELNLTDKIEEIYGRTINELETEWIKYVDTVTIKPNDFVYFINQAEIMLNYKLMLEYSLGFLDIAKTHSDSTMALPFLKRAYFFNGSYYKATEIQQLIVDRDSSTVLDRMALGSYKMMNGYYREAYNDLMKARSLDSTNMMVQFNLALYYLHQNEPETARTILLNNISNEQRAQAQAESRLILANILKNSDDSTQQKKAGNYYRETVNILEQNLQINPSSPTLYLWLGVAYLGLDDINTSLNYLHLAEFLETRPFYLGMNTLWLGKAYQAYGDKETAREYYSRVLALPSADYHQSEAKTHLQQLEN